MNILSLKTKKIECHGKPRTESNGQLSQFAAATTTAQFRGKSALF
jgi:hypothetical protein